MLVAVTTLLASATAHVEESSAPILERIQHLQALSVPEEATLEGGSLQVTWSDCGNGALGKIQSLEPSTMMMGQTTEMVGKGTLSEDVSGGTFVMKVDAGILRKTFHGNMCDPATFQLSMMGIHAGTLGWEGVKCPLKAGEITVKMTSMLSASLPRGMARATITVKATSTSGKELTCLAVHTK